MLIYLAGPLDGISAHEGQGWYARAAACAPEGAVLYCPGRAFLYAGRNPRSVDYANRAVIKAADVLIARLDGPGRALGTCREIEYAKSLGKPVIVVGDLSRSLMAWDLHVVDSIQEAMERCRVRTT